MDIPPYKIDPPAIVRPHIERIEQMPLRQKYAPLTLEDIAEKHPIRKLLLTGAKIAWHNVFPPQETLQEPSEYLRNACKEWTWFLSHFVHDSQIIDHHGAIENARHNQTLHALNHQTLFDVVQVPVNYHLKGIGDVAIVTRENMHSLPIFGKPFAKTPAIVVPFNDDAYMGPTIKQTLHALKEKKDIVWFGEGKRSRTGVVLPFTDRYTSFLWQHAHRKDMALYASPEALVYDSIIEKPFFPIADFFKKNYEKIWGKAGYLLTDFSAFGVRALRNATVLRQSGKVLHVFGSPFDIRECKDGTEVSARIYEEVKAMKNHYQDRIRDWDIRQSDIHQTLLTQDYSLKEKK